MQYSGFAVDVKAIEDLYHAAKRQPFAVPGPIDAIWQRFQHEHRAAMAGDPRTWPTPAQRAAQEERASAIARKAADELRAIMAVPRDDREEAWARATGKPSPKAMRESDLARIRIQHERDTKAREDANTDPQDFVAKLLKREIVVYVSEGRL